MACHGLVVSAGLKTLSANEAEIIFSGAVENGWHIYSTDLPEGGPISATFNVDKIEGAEVVGKLMPRGKEIEKMDPIFEMKVRYFEKQATFVQKIKLTGGDYKIVGYLEYGACNDENCLPPTSVDFAFTGKAAGNTPATAETAITENTATEVTTDTAQTAPATTVTSGTADYWAPVITELGNYGENINNESHTWIYIFFTGMLGGLLALFTPCVWPIIPMTHLRSFHCGDLCWSGINYHRYMGSQRIEFPFYECDFQHLLLPDAGGIRGFVLRSFRNYPAIPLE